MIVHPVLAKKRFEQGIKALLDNPLVYEQTGLRLVAYDFPILLLELQWRLKGQWLRFRIDATDYNYLPLQGWWVDQANNPQLSGAGIIPQGGGFQINPAPNGEARAWLCFKGWRDWHDHSSHQDIAWAAIRHLHQCSTLALLQQLHSTLNTAQVNSI